MKCPFDGTALVHVHESGQTGRSTKEPYVCEGDSARSMAA